MFGKRKVAAIVAEFLGTGVLTLLILSIQRTQFGIPLFVGLTAGAAVVVLTFAIGALSGAHLNPAITVGMWTARKTPTLTALCYIVMQFLGAYCAYLLYRYLVTDNPNTLPILQSFKEHVDTHFQARVLISEMVGTAIFAFAVASTVYQRFTTAMSAAVSGLAYAIGIIAAGTITINMLTMGLLNPAVVLGEHNWIWTTYVLGPVLGAVIGINLYGLLFAESEPVAAAAAVTTVTVAPVVARASKPARSKSAAVTTTTKKASVKKKPARAKK